MWERQISFFSCSNPNVSFIYWSTINLIWFVFIALSLTLSDYNQNTRFTCLLFFFFPFLSCPWNVCKQAHKLTYNFMIHWHSILVPCPIRFFFPFGKFFFYFSHFCCCKGCCFTGFSWKPMWQFCTFSTILRTDYSTYVAVLLNHILCSEVICCWACLLYVYVWYCAVDEKLERIGF